MFTWFSLFPILIKTRSLNIFTFVCVQAFKYDENTVIEDLHGSRYMELTKAEFAGNEIFMLLYNITNVLA